MLLIIFLLVICGISSVVMAQNGNDWGIDYQSEFDDLEYFNQEAWGSETENIAQIIQNGDNNTALTVQTGNSNKAFITQIGNANSAEIKQFSDNNTALIKQLGSNNKAVIIQD